MENGMEMQTAVTSQPGPYGPSDFQTGLFDITSDGGTCFKGLCCLPCMVCSIASDMDECCCVALYPIRSVYRTRHNIKGSLFEDAKVFCCCPACAACQLRRDIDLRKKSMAESVTYQPGPYVSSYVPSDFQTGLCGCGCCCRTCCRYSPLPMIWSIANDMDESSFIPLWYCCCYACGSPIRSVYRTRYNIKGSMCKDAMVFCCCPLCAMCQLRRDIDLRKEQDIFRK